MSGPKQQLQRFRHRAGSVAASVWASDKPGSRLAALLVTLLFIIMIVPQGFDYSNALTAMPTSSDSTSRTIWLILLAGGAYLVLRYRARTGSLIKEINPYLLAFVALATVSYLWSIDPSVTLRRVSRVWTIVAVCIGFTLVGWHARRFQNVLRTMLTLVLVASVIFIYTSPTLAVHQQSSAELAGAWHGITTGKNLFGSLSSACMLLWLHAWISKQARLWSIAFGLALSVTCLIASKSSTSIMASVFAVMFMVMLLRTPASLRRYMPTLVSLFAAVILLYALAVLKLVPGLDFILAPITTLTGKDLTFSGRTNIWYVLNLHIHLAPILGSGYGAYWVGPDPASPSYVMLQWLYYYPTEGHNGYLDVVNDLGLVGAIVLLGYFVKYIQSALALMKIDRFQGGLYLTLLFRGLLADMSESHWFSVLSVDFVVMTLATVALARSLLQARLERPATGLRAKGTSGARTVPARQARRVGRASTQ